MSERIFGQDRGMKTVQEIAEQFGVHPQTVRSHLRKAGEQILTERAGTSPSSAVMVSVSSYTAYMESKGIRPRPSRIKEPGAVFLVWIESNDGERRIAGAFTDIIKANQLSGRLDVLQHKGECYRIKSDVEEISIRSVESVEEFYTYFVSNPVLRDLWVEKDEEDYE